MSKRKKNTHQSSNRPQIPSPPSGGNAQKISDSTVADSVQEGSGTTVADDFQKVNGNTVAGDVPEQNNTDGQAQPSVGPQGLFAKCFRVDCLTNLHVGSGEASYEIIDNLVERDPVTNLPTINSSGVKGALREIVSDLNWLKPEQIETLFGSKVGATVSKAGSLKFLNAHILSQPLRASVGNAPYYRCTTPAMLNQWLADRCAFWGKEQELIDSDLQGKNFEAAAAVEGIECVGSVPVAATNWITAFCGDQGFLLSDKTYREKVKLPVVARNQLENGISKNLWYEEFVPYKSVFYFFVLQMGNDEKDLETFAQAVRGKIVQFGGNASIGYGLVKLREMGLDGKVDEAQSNAQANTEEA